MTETAKLWLDEYTETLPTGEQVQMEYDREGDVLEIFFTAGSATGIELADEIVLRYDRSTATPRSLIFTSFSQLVKDTEYGPESFPLTGIESLSPQQREEILRILRIPPVSHFLQLSAVQLPDSRRPIPLTLVRRLPIAA